MLRVKNGTVKVSGDRQETVYDLTCLMVNLLVTTRIGEDEIPEIIDLAIREKNCLRQPDRFRPMKRRFAMFEPTIFELVLLAALTLAAFAVLVKALPTISHNGEAGEYRAEKIKAVKGYKFELAPVRHNVSQGWDWEGDLHE